MKAIIAIVFAPALLIAPAVAQAPSQPPRSPHPPNVPGPGPDMPNHPHPPPNPDPLAHLMFPPDMIMAHARELNLTDEQKAFMRSEIKKAMPAFQDLQWKLQD